MSLVPNSLVRLGNIVCRRTGSRLFIVSDDLALRYMRRSISGFVPKRSFALMSSVRSLSRRRQSIMPYLNKYLSSSARDPPLNSTGLADQILKSKTQSAGDDEKLKSEELSEEAKEKERAEQKRVQENSVRAVKITLLAFASIFVGGGIYLFFVWGAPLTDRMENEIKDEFSDLPFVEQYLKRCHREIKNYATFLAEPSREQLLPDPVKPPYIQPPYTLLIELTGVLVHPDWTYKTGWRFKKRPGINYFLDKITSDYSFEIVIYTQELGFTAFPIIDALDSKQVVSYRLFRDSTKYVDGHHVKDLDRINRDLKRVIMIDCNPASVENHRSNSIVLPKWLGNDDDRSLFDLAALLQTISSSEIDDVRVVLDHYANFEDPISQFREKQRILAEQEKENEALMKHIGAKQQMPGFSVGWFPSIFRRTA